MKCPKCRSDNPETATFCADCGTKISLPKDVDVTETLETPKEELTTGSTFAGRYQIIEELGKGGMGKVYRALDKKLNEEVALKLIKPEIASDRKTLERFSNELKLARKISHRNVGRMYELLEEKGTHYITMEYVPGEDLRSSIRRFGQLPIGKSISIAKQICEGLTEAHRLGVVHRDLKPSNIMIDKEGNARIMDFGIARSMRGKGVTGAGVMIGTPEYMSPEQAEAKEVDQSSDIYSFGVVLYEMTTGCLPFRGDTPLAVAMKHKSEIPKNPQEFNPQVPDDLCNVILKCLEKDKENRYQNAGEVRSQLEKLEQGTPTTDRAIPERKSITSKEITVTFGLKKLFIPALAVIAIVVIGLLIWSPWALRELSSPSTERPSIAVLPFDDLSPEKDQEHFCDGMAESIINVLNKVKYLRVPAKTSSFSFKGKESTIQEIGERLKVDTILSGSVQKSGDKVRISAQLVNVADESYLWSEQYNRDLDDVFAVQDEIALAIVDNLKVNLVGEEREAVTKRYTYNIEAYNLYLLGRYFWNKRTEKDLNKAIEYFDRALEIDQDYALGYVGKADSFNMLAAYGFLTSKVGLLEAKEAALKALDIDETLAAAHASLANTIMSYEWDWEKAENEYKRAIQLNPNYPTAFHWYAFHLMFMLRTDESIDAMNRAKELAPLSLIINVDLGRLYYWARQFDKAEEQLIQALELDKGFWKTHLILGQVYIQNEKYEDAIAELLHAQKLSPSNYTDAVLGYVYGLSGRKSEALKIHEELKTRSQNRYVPASNLALIHVGVGNKNDALYYLEKGYEERDRGLKQSIVEPMFDSLRTDTRFKLLLQKMNLK